jgi:hypothetical protein
MYGSKPRRHGDVIPGCVRFVLHVSIHQGDATSNYVKLVAGRFASISEIGELKLEAFAPTGGGTVRSLFTYGRQPSVGHKLHAAYQA